MSQSEQPQATPNKGARYQRTFGGLIGSMIVSVIAVLIYWALQNGTHQRPEFEQEDIDYVGAVRGAQEAGYTVAYPKALPEGAKVTSLRFTRGDDVMWSLSIHTKDGEFIGVQQENERIDDLVDTYVDEKAKRGDDVTLDSELVSTWATYTDDGGDIGFAGDWDGTKLLVFGSADDAEVKAIAESLTIEPLTRD